MKVELALGIRVLGQFRDIDRVNQFVWLRGFADHDARGEALTSFYDGPVWRQHAAEANATMIASSDVHQLHAATERKRLRLRPSSDRDSEADRGSVVIVVAHRRVRGESDDDRLMRECVTPRLKAAGLRTIGIYTTDPTENPFPALPVRPSNVLVWIAAGDGLDPA